MAKSPDLSKLNVETRERITVDIVLKSNMELNDRQRQKIAQKVSTLAHVIAFDDMEDVAVVHVDTKLSYMHRHESSYSYACNYCVQQAEDEQNSQTHR